MDEVQVFRWWTGSPFFRHKPNLWLSHPGPGRPVLVPLDAFDPLSFSSVLYDFGCSVWVPMQGSQSKNRENGGEERGARVSQTAPVISPLRSLTHDWAEKLEIRSRSSQVEWRRICALCSGRVGEPPLSGSNNQALPSHPPERRDQPHQLSEGSSTVKDFEWTLSPFGTQQRSGSSRAISPPIHSRPFLSFLGDQAGECRAHGNLGSAFFSKGNYREALTNHRNQLVLAMKLKDREVRCDGLGSSRLGSRAGPCGDEESRLKTFRSSRCLAQHAAPVV